MNLPAYTVLVLQETGTKYLLTRTDRPDLPFTHKITGNHGDIYGNWTPTSGRAVRVRSRGWSDRRGVHGTFHAPETCTLKGWSV